ncbi:MAG TPA: branched-chain amino acid ABC transporter substrate-binding protein [Thermoanaerobaculia bacterium]|nr:branched-chain amino acid ABC transporter substrate-binding protein [Thermoanaerobaculia bacterium]
MKRALASAAALALLLIAGSGCPRPGDGKETVKIGFIGPLSGDAASFGNRMKNAVELAVEEFQGKTPVAFEVIYKDDRMDVGQARQAMDAFLADPSVIAVIGAGRSQVVQMEAELAAPSGLVVISPTATSPSLSAPEYTHFFRVIPSDAYQGRFLAEMAVNRNLSNVAIAYLTDDYGNGLRNEFRRTFTSQAGKRIAAEQGFSSGEAEFEPLILSILRHNPDGVFVAGMPQEIADFLVDAHKIKDVAKIQFLAPEVFRSPDSLNRADKGEAAQNVLVSGTEANLSKQFLDSYRSKFTQGQPDEEPDAFAGNAYDAAKALFIALQQGAKTRQELQRALGQEDFKFSGASGTVAFDPNGDIDTKNYSLYVVQGKDFVRIASSGG